MFYSDLYSKSSDQRMNFQFDKMLNNYTKQIKNCQISHLIIMKIDDIITNIITLGKQLIDELSRSNNNNNIVNDYLHFIQTIQLLYDNYYQQYDNQYYQTILLIDNNVIDENSNIIIILGSYNGLLRQVITTDDLFNIDGIMKWKITLLAINWISPNSIFYQMNVLFHDLFESITDNSSNNQEIFIQQYQQQLIQSLFNINDYLQYYLSIIQNELNIIDELEKSTQVALFNIEEQKRKLFSQMNTSETNNQAITNILTDTTKTTTNNNNNNNNNKLLFPSNINPTQSFYQSPSMNYTYSTPSCSSCNK